MNVIVRRGRGYCGKEGLKVKMGWKEILGFLQNFKIGVKKKKILMV